MTPFPKNPPSERKREQHQDSDLSPRKQLRYEEATELIPDRQQKNDHLKVLWWNSPADHVPVSSEEAMIEVLVRWKKKERGMIKDQPPFRLDKIKKQLRKSKGITLTQALSLRRHHMKLLNPKVEMNRLRLGSNEDIRESARLFEEAVKEFLIKCRIAFWTETEQRQLFDNTGTPDFLLRKEVVLKKVRGRGDHSRLLEQRKIHWIEAKMFYGASTIPHGTMGAVGGLLATAKKYVEEFGEGGMVFLQGCGDQLAADLAEVGVTALDCSGTVSLKTVQQHQRTWCADENGLILP